MKTIKINLEEIKSLDSLALTTIIDYWKEYDVNTVLLAYLELKNQNFSSEVSLINKLNTFCANFNIVDINASAIIANNRERENQWNTVNHLQVDPIKIKAAGKCFRSIVNNILFLLICDSIGAFAVFKNLKDGENLNTTFLFIGVVNLILYIFILYNIYEAGNNLENSVIKKSIVDKA